MTPCRCGYDGTGVHRCHAGRMIGDRCPREGIERLVAHEAGLTGTQIKFGATYACYCAEHWLEAGFGPVTETPVKTPS